MCIDIVEIWFGVAFGQFLTNLSVHHMSVFSFLDYNNHISMDFQGGGRVVRRCCVSYITGASN